MDPIILLTPVAALAIVLLLGFAGCHLVFGSDPPLVPFLTLRVRVPEALVVRQIVFTWDPPNTASDSKPLTKPDPSGFEGEENFFDHDLSGEPDYGGWTVRCRVTVQGGAGQGPEGEGTFNLDDSFAHPVATFRAMGDAADLSVTFDNVYEKT